MIKDVVVLTDGKHKPAKKINWDKIGTVVGRVSCINW